MVKTLIFIIGILFASVVNADTVSQIDDLQFEMGDKTQIPHNVLKQCGGILRFTLNIHDPRWNIPAGTSVPTETMEAYYKNHQFSFKMSDYFSQASEKMFIADGLDFEHANYQMGMSKFFYAQQYINVHSEILETTGHPWADDSPFRITHQAHMDICTKIYNMKKPNEQVQ